MEAMDVLHGARSAGTHGSSASSRSSPRCTQDILLATIDLQLETGSLVPRRPNEETPAEKFLCRSLRCTRCVPTRFSAAKSPSRLFMGLHEEKQLAAAAPHGVSAKCLALFRKQCYSNFRGTALLGRCQAVYFFSCQAEAFTGQGSLS